MSFILNEGGGKLLTEAGGSLATEAPSSSVALPVAQVAAAAPLPVPVVSVPLPAAGVAVSAPLPSSHAGPVALPVAQVAAAAPLPAPAVSVPLPVAQVTETAYVLTPQTGVTVGLPVAQVAVAAPLPSLAAGPVALPAAAVAAAAPLPSPAVSVPLPVAQETAAAHSPASAAGPVSLPAAAVAVSAPLLSPSVTVPLPAGAVTAAAPLTAPSVSVPLPAAQVNVAGHPVTPSEPIFVALPVAQVAVAAPAATPFVPPVFPLAPLDLECQLNLGGTWTDVTAYAYQRDGTSPPISITRGRPDESSQANPSTCTWEWNNRDGRFSPKNPVSPYYGQLGRNTPVRWSVPAASSYLRLENNNDDRAACVEASRLDITGSIEMRLSLRLTDWRQCFLAAKQDGGGCWQWVLNDDGTTEWGWQVPSGPFLPVTSTVPIPFTSGDMALRVTMNASTGTVTFYTAPGASVDPGTWTQLGDAQSATGGTSTSIATASSPLVVGWSTQIPADQLCGRVYEYRLYNSSGTVVADPVFAVQAPGVTSFSDTPGNTWLVQGGAEISARDYRFHGEMSAQPPKWDVTGADMSVMAQAGGPLRRLGQGTNNTVSAVKRAILAQTGSFAPVAYWPMEDAAGATSFGSAVTGGSPMTFDLSPAPDLATDSSFTASAPLPTVNGSRLQGPVAPYTPTGSWAVRGLLKVSPPTANATLLRIVCPSGACPVVYINVDTSGNLELEGFSPGGSSAFNTGFFDFDATEPLMFSVEAVPAGGGGVQYTLVTVAPGASSGFILTETVSNGLPSGNVTYVQPDVTGAFAGTVMGHVQVQSAVVNLFSLGQPLNAWDGETAADRYARLAGENGYQARILGSPAYSALMGPQGEATLSALLQECETADLGQQYEPRQQLSLGYRTLASMCGQPPGLSLDYSQSQPGGVNGDGSDSGLDPTYDDQLSKNDWTVTRGAASGNQGATVQVTLDDGSAMSISDPPVGIGDYANTQTANVEDDSQIVDVAGWMVHIGTVDEARWPVIPVNLARTEMASLKWNAIGLEVGDHVELLNVPDLVLYDPVEQIALGFKESLGGFHWTHEYNAVPESAYETAVLGDVDYGRPDTDGSALFAGISSTATSMQVVSANPQLVTWTTNSADFPFDINVAGERMTVTNITGTGVSTQTFTVTRSVNGVSKSQSAGADVRLWFAPALALT